MNCREVVDYSDYNSDRDFWEGTEDFYNAYDVVIWFVAGLILLLLFCCIACFCYVRFRKVEVQRLQEYKYRANIMSNDKNDGDELDQLKLKNEIISDVKDQLNLQKQINLNSSLQKSKNQ